MDAEQRSVTEIIERLSGVLERISGEIESKRSDKEKPIPRSQRANNEPGSVQEIKARTLEKILSIGRNAIGVWAGISEKDLKDLDEMFERNGYSEWLES